MAYTLSQVQVDDGARWRWMWAVTEGMRRAVGVRSQLFQPSPAEPNRLWWSSRRKIAHSHRNTVRSGPGSAARLLDTLEAADGPGPAGPQGPGLPSAWASARRRVSDGA